MGSAVAPAPDGLVVGGHVGVAHLKAVKSEASLFVAAHSAGTSRWGGCVEENVHAPIGVKVGQDHLPRIGQLGVVRGASRELRVRRKPPAGGIDRFGKGLRHNGRKVTRCFGACGAAVHAHVVSPTHRHQIGILTIEHANHNVSGVLLRIAKFERQVQLWVFKATAPLENARVVVRLGTVVVGRRNSRSVGAPVRQLVRLPLFEGHAVFVVGVRLSVHPAAPCATLRMHHVDDVVAVDRVVAQLLALLVVFGGAVWKRPH